MKFKNYEFTILRYVHDRITGEFINFGVVLYCREEKTLIAKCKTRTGRISAAFPDFDRHHLKSVIRHIDSALNDAAKRLKNELCFEDISIDKIINRTLKRDDSSLQWGSISSGITLDLNSEIERIYQRYVTFHDTPVARDRRTEQDIWRDFERHLKSFTDIDHFQPKKITVRDDELEFKHAWKNGMWHCVEPVSFDLADADNMKDKAHRWLGQMTSIQNANEEFKLYLLVSKPKEKGLEKAFEKALNILRKIPTDKEVFLEEDADKLASAMKDKIDLHDRHSDRQFII